jgi:hypothetical protein
LDAPAGVAGNGGGCGGPRPGTAGQVTHVGLTDPQTLRGTRSVPFDLETCPSMTVSPHASQSPRHPIDWVQPLWLLQPPITRALGNASTRPSAAGPL